MDDPSSPLPPVISRGVYLCLQGKNLTLQLFDFLLLLLSLGLGLLPCAELLIELQHTHTHTHSGQWWCVARRQSTTGNINTSAARLKHRWPGSNDSSWSPTPWSSVCVVGLAFMCGDRPNLCVNPPVSGQCFHCRSRREPGFRSAHTQSSSDVPTQSQGFWAWRGGCHTELGVLGLTQGCCYSHRGP